MLDLQASIEVAEGRKDEGALLFSRAMDAFERVEYSEPPQIAHMTHESAGWTLLKAGMAAEAETAFRRGLKIRPNSGWLLFGVAEAVRAKDGDDAAKPAYEEFLKQWKDADPDLPYMLKARERLSAMSR